MMSRKKAFRVLIILAVVVVLLMSLKVYYVRTVSGGDLLWNADNAYLFIGMADRGYPFSYLGYLLEQVREILPFGASGPSDKYFSVLVLHVTPNSVQRFSIDNFWLGRAPEPFQGTLYAANMLPGGGLTKWSGTHFEPATPEEAQKLHEYAISLPKGPPAGPSYDNVGGWSKRTLGGEVVVESPTTSVEREARVTIELGGKPSTFVMNSGFITHKAYVDMLRPGQPPQRIWYLDEDARRVSKSDYEQIFRRRTDTK